ncbi:hypothetical protein AB0M86_45845 [Streptomyces sp. NPDC051639]|uniref:hypothetical protein n=1 Tax=Streptomyces sp. NPDC051639 TaxID=3155671 RepID=UPI00342597B9
MTTPRPLYVITVEPVQEVAAEPDTLAALVDMLRPKARPVPGTTALGPPLTGWPLVADPALPAGFVYLRPTPAPKEQP